MKRLGNVFDSVASPENLELAFRKACRGKGWQNKVKHVKKHAPRLLKLLHEQLTKGTYRVSQYHTKTIYEPKRRLIHILPLYPDRIVQHAVMNVLEDYWDAKMVSDSYACRIGKGQHKGSLRCMTLCRQYKYVLKCDISKFYPSLDHDLLKRIVREKLKDERLLKILDDIIGSMPGGVGVPIGSYLSQWFGNLYMNKLDMWIKHEKRQKAYVRYCDDFVVFSNDKQHLHALKQEIVEFCDKVLKLRLSKGEVFPCTQGIDFLGYRHFPDGKILLRKSTAKRMKRRMAHLESDMQKGKFTPEQARAKIASARGWMKHARTHNLALAMRLSDLESIVNAKIQ